MSVKVKDPGDEQSPLEYMSKKWAKVAPSAVELIQGQVTGYARFSTPFQLESSIERQVASIKETATRFSFSAPIMFIDRGISATHVDRDQLQDCLAFCERYPGSILFVETADRLFRSKKSFNEISLRLENSGTRLFDRNGEVHDIMSMLQAIIASEERNRIVFRLTSGRRRAASEGRWMGPVPFGYVKNSDKRLVICPETGPIVQEMFRRRAAGESIPAIAEFLTESNVSTSRNKPGWACSTVSRILCNPIYVGVHRSKLLDEN